MLQLPPVSPTLSTFQMKETDVESMGITLLSGPGKALNTTILERLNNEVDNILRDHQTGLRQDRVCIDQSATIRIIVEQSMRA